MKLGNSVERAIWKSNITMYDVLFFSKVSSVETAIWRNVKFHTLFPLVRKIKVQNDKTR